MMTQVSEPTEGLGTGTPCGICKGPTVWAVGQHTHQLFKRCSKYPECLGKGRSDPGDTLISDRRNGRSIENKGQVGDQEFLRYLLHLGLTSEYPEVRKHAIGLLWDLLEHP